MRTKTILFWADDEVPYCFLSPPPPSVYLMNQSGDDGVPFRYDDNNHYFMLSFPCSNTITRGVGILLYVFIIIVVILVIIIIIMLSSHDLPVAAPAATVAAERRSISPAASTRIVARVDGRTGRRGVFFGIDALGDWLGVKRSASVQCDPRAGTGTGDGCHRRARGAYIRCALNDSAPSSY